MVPTDSGRISRVPPYLGYPPGLRVVSPTGLSPSLAGLPRPLDYDSKVPSVAPLPPPSLLSGFGLLPFRSPLLGESLLFSFPPGTEMFHFPGFASPALSIQAGIRKHYPAGVSPFGYLRIIAWFAAPRSFSQRPTSFIASNCLGIHRVPFRAWSLPPLHAPATTGPLRSHKLSLPFLSSSSFFPCQRSGPAGPLAARRTFHPLVLRTRFSGGADRTRTDDIQLAKLALYQLSYSPAPVACSSVVGLERLELSTPRLSSVCSNQLSYRPFPVASSTRVLHLFQ